MEKKKSYKGGAGMNAKDSFYKKKIAQLKNELEKVREELNNYKEICEIEENAKRQRQELREELGIPVSKLSIHFPESMYMGVSATGTEISSYIRGEGYHGFQPLPAGEVPFWSPYSGSKRVITKEAAEKMIENQIDALQAMVRRHHPDARPTAYYDQATLRLQQKLLKFIKDNYTIIDDD